MPGARYLGIFSYGAIILLVGLILKKSCKFPLSPLAGALLVAVAPTLIETSVMAMTEPLYMALTLASFLCFSYFWEKRQRRWIFLAGLIAGLAFITRYVGLPVILAGCLVLFFGKKRIVEKIRDSVSFGVISIFPMGVWVIRNLLVAGSSTNRHFAYFPISQEDFLLLSQTLDGWIKPASSTFHIGGGKLILGAVTFVTVFLFLRFFPVSKTSQSKENYLMPLQGIYAVCYTGFLFISRLFFDPAITVWEARMLAPIFLCLVMITVWLFEKILFEAGKIHSVLAGILAVGMVWTIYTYGVFFLDETTRYVEKVRSGGAALTETFLRETPFIQTVMQLPEPAIVFTTNVEVFYYFTGRNSFGYQLPLSEDWADSVRSSLQSTPVLFVNFFRDNDLEYQLTSALPFLEVYYEDASGIIFYGP